MIPFIIGGIFQVVGYIGRSLSAGIDQWNLTFFIIQALTLLVAPALYAASIYMTLGRIILLVDGEHHSLIRAKWLTKLFVAGDILSFVTQGAGAGLMAGKTEKHMKNGEKIVIAGLFIQIIVFSLFVAVAWVFHRRILREPTHITARPAPPAFPWLQKVGLGKKTQSKAEIGNPELASDGPPTPWHEHLLALYVTSGLILVRSVFRLIEYFMGNNGYLLKREVFLYIFDAVLMLVVMVWCNVYHPGEILEGRSKDRAAGGVAEDGAVEMVNSSPKAEGSNASSVGEVRQEKIENLG